MANETKDIYWQGKIYQGVEPDSETDMGFETIRENCDCDDCIYSRQLLEKLTSIPVHGSHSFTDGQQVVLGKDYEVYHQYLNINGMHSVWLDCPEFKYHNLPEPKRIIAMAIDHEMIQDFNPNEDEPTLPPANAEVLRDGRGEVKSKEQILHDTYHNFIGTRHTCYNWEPWDDLDTDVKDCVYEAMQLYAEQFPSATDSKVLQGEAVKNISQSGEQC